jgi:hypothetical protein
LLFFLIYIFKLAYNKVFDGTRIQGFIGCKLFKILLEVRLVYLGFFSIFLSWYFFFKFDYFLNRLGCGFVFVFLINI